MTEPARKPLPPYMPYRTFGTFLDHLRAIGMPSHIDKSVMTQVSGAVQSWLKSSLRYMNLINDADEPQPMLAKLAKAQGEARKPLLAELFRSSYGFLNGKIDLANTTPQKLRSAIVELGAQGETVEKIMAFMVAMGKDAGIPLSSLLTTRQPSVRKPRPKTAPKPAAAATLADDDTETDTETTSKAMKTVMLPKSGGSITLSGDINVFNLVGDERALVFALIDKMTEFEAKQGADDA